VSYDLHTPEGRYAASQALGPEGYSAAMEEHLRANTVATVNGYDIRKTESRWGTVYMIDGTSIGYQSLDKAKAHAARLPANISA
jgi:hypothetical protein